MSCCGKKDDDKKYGVDHEGFDSIAPGDLANILFKKNDSVSDGGTLKKFTVRYKPINVTALFIDSEHLINCSAKKKAAVRKTGWLVEGPNRKLIYIGESLFSQFFEIVEEFSSPEEIEVEE